MTAIDVKYSRQQEKKNCLEEQINKQKLAEHFWKKECPTIQLGSNNSWNSFSNKDKEEAKPGSFITTASATKNKTWSYYMR